MSDLSGMNEQEIERIRVALTGALGGPDDGLDLLCQMARRATRLEAAIHQALAHGDSTRLGTVRPDLADAVNEAVIAASPDREEQP